MATDFIKITKMMTEFCLKLELHNKGETYEKKYLEEAVEKSITYLFEESRETLCDFYGYRRLREDASSPESLITALEGVVDGFADTAFVAFNGIFKTLLLAGKSPEKAHDGALEVLYRVCQANLSKLGPLGIPLYNEEGKVVKPKGWIAPRFFDLLS